MIESFSLEILVVGIAAASFGAALGLGGGFVILPYLLWRFPSILPSQAVVLSLSGVLTTNLMASFLHIKKKSVHQRELLWIAPLAAVGALVGSPLPSLLSKQQFEWAYLIIIVGVVTRTALTINKVTPPPQRSERSASSIAIAIQVRKMLWPIIPLVSAFAAAFGIGGGVVLMPILLSQRFQLTMASAAATSAMIQVIGTGSALVAKFSILSDLLGVAISLVMGVSIGAQIGVWASRRLPRRRGRIILTIVLSLIAIQIFIRKVM